MIRIIPAPPCPRELLANPELAALWSLTSACALVHASLVAAYPRGYLDDDDSKPYLAARTLVYLVTDLEEAITRYRIAVDDAQRARAGDPDDDDRYPF
jgi:hypothetical protein